MLNTLLSLAIGVFTLAIFLGLTLIVRLKDRASRIVLVDLVFFCMIGVFLIYALNHDISITYDVPILAGLMGILSTVSLARIFSNGRR